MAGGQQDRGRVVGQCLHLPDACVHATAVHLSLLSRPAAGLRTAMRFPMLTLLPIPRPSPATPSLLLFSTITRW